MSSFSELTFTETTKVSLWIDGVEVNATWSELATQLTKATDIATVASVDIFFLLFSAALVFIMQAGFTLLEVGRYAL